MQVRQSGEHKILFLLVHFKIVLAHISFLFLLLVFSLDFQTTEVQLIHYQTRARIEMGMHNAKYDKLEKQE